jgi:ligand-binding SRPBCC domain-containing protein
MYQLDDRFIVKADMDTVWRFFGDPQNLARITPAHLGFTVLTPSPITMQRDTVLDYTIRWAGLPVKWRTIITEWEPPRYFADLQARGPYAQWLHRHAFESSDEGVICSDRVLYKMPGGLIGRAMNALVVKRQLTNIFRFRRDQISKELGWVRELAPISIKRV